jgi:hypothetical protein
MFGQACLEEFFILFPPVASHGKFDCGVYTTCFILFVSVLQHVEDLLKTEYYALMCVCVLYEYALEFAVWCL